MRTLVDLPEKHLEELTALSKERKVSRAHLVRCAVEKYLEQEKPRSPDEALRKLAGAWADRNIDGLEYQMAMRAEWDREF